MTATTALESVLAADRAATDRALAVLCEQLPAALPAPVAAAIRYALLGEV